MNPLMPDQAAAAETLCSAIHEFVDGDLRSKGCPEKMRGYLVLPADNLSGLLAALGVRLFRADAQGRFIPIEITDAQLLRR